MGSSSEDGRQSSDDELKPAPVAEASPHMVKEGARCGEECCAYTRCELNLNHGQYFESNSCASDEAQKDSSLSEGWVRERISFRLEWVPNTRLPNKPALKNMPMLSLTSLIMPRLT